MSDIFLSYSAKDRERARRLADRLQAAGWSVWWDRRIPAGRTWRSVLAHELETMRCMVVLWSKHSVTSDWVCEEATEGRQLGKLVPVALDSVRPPAGFRELQAADLVDWDGANNFAGLQQLLDDISRLIGPPVPVAPAPPQPSTAAPTATPKPAPPGQRWRWAAAAAVLVVASGAWLQRGDSTTGRVAPLAALPGVPVASPVPAMAAAAAPAVAPTATPSTTPASNPARQPASVITPQAAQQPAQRLAERVATSRPTPGPTPRAPTNPRCSALLERAALGEALAADAQAFLRQECHP